MGIFTSKIFLQISMAIHSESNLNQSEPIWNLEFLQFFRLPVWNEYESNLKPIWNLKIQSNTELEGEVNLTQSETELEGKVNWTQYETEIEGDFCCGGLSLRFHPRQILLGGLKLGLDFPLLLDPHRFCPDLPFGANPNGLPWNLSLLVHNGPLNLRQLLWLLPHLIDSCRLIFARTVLSF